MKLRKVFVHHDGALGDTLLSLPCISVIREPACHIHVAGRRDVMQFLKEAGIADEVSFADSRRYSSLYTEAIDEEMKSFLSGFDTSFVFTANAESRLVKNIRSVISDTRAILTIAPEARTEHAAAFRIKQLGCGEDAVQRKIAICLSDEERKWATEFLKEQGCAAEHRLITVHPGSGGKKKCWPLASYASVIRILTSNPLFFCLVFSGPAEDAETLRVLEQLAWKDKRIVHLHDAPLIRVAALLDMSNFYMGNDSGISHLAGIMKCSGAVLFGPTDPGSWMPIGDTLEVIHFENLSELALLRLITKAS
jgi:heptosyltransferase-3